MAIRIPIKVSGEAELRKLEHRFNRVEREGKQAFSSIGNEATRLRQTSTGFIGELGALRNKLLVFGFASAGVISVFKKVVSESSNLEESINAVNVVFSDGAGEILKFGESAATSVGLANSEFNQLATVTGALLKDTGLSMQGVSDQTVLITQRAADLASVFNTSVQDALSAFNQAIRGETEAIRRYAGDVTEATLQQFAFSKGISKSVTSMSEQEKRLLRVQLILDQTDDVQGDFLNTQDSLANQTRILSSNIKDLAADFGDELTPSLAGILGTMNDILALKDEWEEFRRTNLDWTPTVTEFKEEVEGLEQAWDKLLTPEKKFDPLMRLMRFIVNDFSTDLSPQQALFDSIIAAAVRAEGLKSHLQEENQLRQDALALADEQTMASEQWFVTLSDGSLVFTKEIIPANEELLDLIELTNDEIGEAPPLVQQVSASMQVLGGFARGLSDQLGVAIIQGESLSRVFDRLIQQLASRALSGLFLGGIASLIPGLGFGGFGAAFLTGFRGFASGTSFAPGGPAIVGEQGPELVNLPRGSQVFSAGDTQGMMGNTIQINVTAQSFDERFVRHTLAPMMRKLSKQGTEFTT